MMKDETEAEDGDILSRILKEDEDNPQVNYIVITAEHGIYVKPENDAPVLAYRYGGEHGTIAALFSTNGFVEYMRAECAAAFEKHLESAEAEHVDGTMRPLKDLELPDEETKAKIICGLTHLAVRNFISGLQPKLSTALAEHEREVMILTKGVLQANIGKAFKTIKQDNIREEADRLVKEMRAERANFIHGSLKRIFGDAPDFTHLQEYYRTLKPVWDDIVKEIYPKNKDSNWRGMARAKYEEKGIALYDDLLTRVEGVKAIEALPKKLRESIRHKGEAHTAANLAMEHAARMCKAPRYYRATHTYFDKIRRSTANNDATVSR